MDWWLQLHEYRAADLAREAQDAHLRRSLPRPVGTRRTAAGILLGWLAPGLARLEGPRRTGTAIAQRQAAAPRAPRVDVRRGAAVPCPAC
ncbi:hypothetical protein [Georgenia ruanii]|uniref:hypothetical protein n=1 Tax=Georgenia ruanii TaxID=348442 RepID=UPI0012643441|nr:hypothetical protein [Georgenia ruanii]